LRRLVQDGQQTIVETHRLAFSFGKHLCRSTGAFTMR
jgi:hypothetical protein